MAEFPEYKTIPQVIERIDDPNVNRAVDEIIVETLHKLQGVARTMSRNPDMQNFSLMANYNAVIFRVIDGLNNYRQGDLKQAALDAPVG